MTIPPVATPGAGAPPHTLLADGEGASLQGWTVRAHRGAIASTACDEALTHELGIKLPGMLFADSALTLSHASGLSLSFRAVAALRGVGPPDPSIRVVAARVWDHRAAPAGVDIGVVDNPSDWTFSTGYGGDVEGGGVEGGAWREGGAVDYALLRRQDVPIVYFGEVILFEDELDDNGTSSYRVRVRVHPGFFFVLARFFLRVDGVLVRVRDTRYFHVFGSGVVVRERTEREARAEELPLGAPVRSPDEVAGVLPLVRSSVEQMDVPSMDVPST